MSVQGKVEQSQYMLAYNELGAYCVPASSSSRVCSQHILNGRVFEPKMLEFVAKHAGSGDIVHAGTFFGDFLPAFSRACQPGAKVWSFEPVDENYRCAQVTIQLNRLDNVELLHAGLGPSAGKGVIVTHDASGAALGEVAYVSQAGDASGTGSEDIRILAVDDVVPDDRQVSILQLDVEGFETAAMEGALETIRRCRPIIILETAPADDWIRRHLTPLGYAVAGGVHANVVFATKRLSSPVDRIRWVARQSLKAVLPNALRRRFRKWQSEQQIAARPDARSTGALDCRIAEQDGQVVCSVSDPARLSVEDRDRVAAINAALNPR